MDPKKLLEDGIRKELVLQVSRTLHDGLTFNPRARTPELESKLKALASKMSGFRRSFEYIQVSIKRVEQVELLQVSFKHTLAHFCNNFLQFKIFYISQLYTLNTTYLNIHTPHTPSITLNTHSTT